MSNNSKAASPCMAGTMKDTALDSRSQDISKPSDYQVVTDSSTASQQKRVLLWLRNKGPLTALQALHELDVLRLAARIKELRARGYQIETLWVDDTTQEGNLHRVGLYVLRTTGKQLSLPGLDAAVEIGEVFLREDQ